MNNFLNIYQKNIDDAVKGIITWSNSEEILNIYINYINIVGVGPDNKRLLNGKYINNLNDNTLLAQMPTTTLELVKHMTNVYIAYIAFSNKSLVKKNINRKLFNTITNPTLRKEDYIEDFLKEYYNGKKSKK